MSEARKAAVDIYRVVAVGEKASWFRMFGRLALSFISDGGVSLPTKTLVRVIDRETEMIVLEHKWDSALSAEEFRAAYGIGP